ncbi:hypothetical protein Tco_0730341 [Tanacetum coccineum]|uniref:Uncharacterized protein n=1 Tax=Tanacetum coccineum TaxID=301880 RepID=A0ABQ4YRX2_9ASTR
MLSQNIENFRIREIQGYEWSQDNDVPVGPVFLLGLLALAIDATCAFRAEEMPSLISCWMAAKVMAGVSDVDVLLGGILSTEDNTYSSGTKKYRGSNSNDGGNTGDGVKIAGGVIGSGDEIGSLRIHNDQRIAAMMGYRGGRGLEGDEEGLDDVLFKLETSFDELFISLHAAARNEETRNHLHGRSRQRWLAVSGHEEGRKTAVGESTT